MARVTQVIAALRSTMKGTRGRNTILSASEAVALAFLQFAAYLILVRIAAPEAVSLWVLVNSLLSVARAADFSAQGLVSFVAEARSKGEDSTAHSYITTSIIIGSAGYSLLAACGCAVLYFALPSMVDAQQASAVRPQLPLFGVVFALSSLAGIYKLAFLGLERVGPKVVQTVGGMAIFIAASIVLAPSWGLTGILFAQLIQAMASLLYAMYWYHRGRMHTRFGQYWDSSIARNILAYGVQSMTVNWVQLTIEPVIRMLANHFGGLNSVLLVELASRSIMAVRSLLLSAGQVLIPKFSAAADSDQRSMGQSILLAEQFYFAVGAPLLMLAVIVVPVLSVVASVVDVENLVIVTSILSLTWFFNIVAAPTYFFLVGQRRVRELFWSNIIMTAGSALAGTMLGHLGGLHGALSGTTGSFLASSLMMMSAIKPLIGGNNGVARWHGLKPPLTANIVAASVVWFAIERQIFAQELSLAWWFWNCLAFLAAVAAGIWGSWATLDRMRKPENNSTSSPDKLQS